MCTFGMFTVVRVLLPCRALAHPDVPVVSGLYHVLLQPHSHLQAWAQHAAAHGLGTDPEAAAAESRATAAHCLLVLAIQQDAVMAAEWLLSSLEELHGAAQGNAPSTLSALVQHQRRAWETGSDQDKLQMLAGAREMAMQQVCACRVAARWLGTCCTKVAATPRSTLVALSSPEGGSKTGMTCWLRSPMIAARIQTLSA